jgi:hypothetical protein
VEGRGRGRLLVCRVGGHAPRQAEIEHLDQAVRGHDDVGAFEVVMDDAPAVGVCERRGNLQAVTEHRLDWEPGLANQLGQRLPLDDLHCDVQGVARLDDFVHGADVGVVEG